MRIGWILAVGWWLALVGPAGAADAPEVGQKVPDFTVPTVGGGTFRLADSLATGPVVLWFSNFCEDCQANFSDFGALATRCTPRKVHFLVISTLQEDTLKVLEIARARNIAFTLALDPNGKLCDTYGSLVSSDACPMTTLYAIDQSGVCRLADHFPGPGKEPLQQWLRQNGCP